MEPMIALKGIAKGQSLNEAKTYNNNVPIMTPIMPPIAQSIVASTKN